MFSERDRVDIRLNHIAAACIAGVIEDASREPMASPDSVCGKAITAGEALAKGLREFRDGVRVMRETGARYEPPTDPSPAPSDPKPAPEPPAEAVEAPKCSKPPFTEPLDLPAGIG